MTAMISIFVLLTLPCEKFWRSPRLQVRKRDIICDFFFHLSQTSQGWTGNWSCPCDRFGSGRVCLAWHRNFVCSQPKLGHLVLGLGWNCFSSIFRMRFFSDLNFNFVSTYFCFTDIIGNGVRTLTSAHYIVIYPRLRPSSRS